MNTVSVEIVMAPRSGHLSGASRLNLKGWEEAAQHADTVLDVQQMQQWLPAVGTDTTDIALEGAVHDVLLSAPPVRQRALAEIDHFLERIASQTHPR